VTKLVFRRLLVNKAWQALSPALNKVWVQQRLARDKPLPTWRRAHEAQRRRRAQEHRPLLMQPEQMFRVRKLACLQREQLVCPQRINLVLAQRTLPAQLVVLQEQALKHLAQPV
jgi:hypothetical protein